MPPIWGVALRNLALICAAGSAGILDRVAAVQTQSQHSTSDASRKQATPPQLNLAADPNWNHRTLQDKHDFAEDYIKDENGQDGNHYDSHFEIAIKSKEVEKKEHAVASSKEKLQKHRATVEDTADKFLKSQEKARQQRQKVYAKEEEAKQANKTAEVERTRKEIAKRELEAAEKDFEKAETEAKQKQQELDQAIAEDNETMHEEQQAHQAHVKALRDAGKERKRLSSAREDLDAAEEDLEEVTPGSTNDAAPTADEHGQHDIATRSSAIMAIRIMLVAAVVNLISSSA